MPCGCDGMEITELEKERDAHERDRKMLCKAQLLIHRLAKILEDKKLCLTEKLANEISEHSKLFLKHKRVEEQNERNENRRSYQQICTQIAQIGDLGGVPKEELIRKAEILKQRCDSALLTDEQLLNE